MRVGIGLAFSALLLSSGTEGKGGDEFGRGGMAGVGSSGIDAGRLPTLEIPLGVLV